MIDNHIELYYELRLLSCYGDSAEDIFDLLKKVKCVRRFSIATELKPYLHYHILFMVWDKNLKQMNRIIANIPRRWNTRAKNNYHLDVVKDIKSYESYMRKEGNPIYHSHYDIEYDNSIFQFIDSAERAFLSKRKPERA